MENAIANLRQTWTSLSSQELFVVLCHIQLSEEGALLEENEAVQFHETQGLIRRILPKSLINRFTHQNEARDPTIAISHFHFRGQPEPYVITWTSVSEHTVLINVLRKSQKLEHSDLQPSNSLTHRCSNDFTSYLAANPDVPLSRLTEEVAQVLRPIIAPSLSQNVHCTPAYERHRPTPPHGPPRRADDVFPGELIGPHHPIFRGRYSPAGPGTIPGPRIDPIWPDDPLGRRHEVGRNPPDGPGGDMFGDHLRGGPGFY